MSYETTWKKLPVFGEAYDEFLKQMCPLHQGFGWYLWDTNILRTAPNAEDLCNISPQSEKESELRQQNHKVAAQNQAYNTREVAISWKELYCVYHTRSSIGNILVNLALYKWQAQRTWMWQTLPYFE